MSRFRAVGCWSFAAHAHHQSSGQRRVTNFSRSADRQPLHRWERFRQGCSTSEGEGRRTSSPPLSRDELDGRAQRKPSAAVPKAPPTADRQGGRWRSRGVDLDALPSQPSGTTIPKKWRFSRRRWRRHRCKPEPLQQRHRSLRPCSSSSVRKTRTCGASESPVSTAFHQGVHQGWKRKGCVLKLHNSKPKFRTLPLRNASFRHAQHVYSWRGVCMGGRVPRTDAVKVGTATAFVELDRSRSGASDRADQSTVLSCVCERIRSRNGLRGVRVGCADILEEGPAESMTSDPK